MSVYDILPLTFLPVIVLGAGVIWWRIQRRARKAAKCWQCGTDLSANPPTPDREGKLRCPKCSTLADK